MTGFSVEHLISVMIVWIRKGKIYQIIGTILKVIKIDGG